MDTTAIISIIVVFGAVIVPIIISAMRKQKKKQQFTDAFSNLGASEQLNITESEQWNQHAIGIDRDASKIMYVNDFPNRNKIVIIDLSEVKSIEIHEIARSVNTQSGNTKVLDQLHIKFNMKNKELSAFFLEFYNAASNNIPVHELQLASKWKALIESSLYLLKKEK